MKKHEINRKCKFYTKNLGFPFCDFHKTCFTLTKEKPRKLIPQCWRCKSRRIK
jgi:hypothetical protein